MLGWNCLKHCMHCSISSPGFILPPLLSSLEASPPPHLANPLSEKQLIGVQLGDAASTQNKAWLAPFANRQPVTLEAFSGGRQVDKDRRRGGQGKEQGDE